MTPVQYQHRVMFFDCLAMFVIPRPAARPDADVIDDGRGEGCSGRPCGHTRIELPSSVSQVESGGTTADILS